MKRTIITLAMALAALCSVTVFASAAEANADIKVQLDGQVLEFTDAKPQIVENRTFLPFRSVFEAMGAEVSADGNVITAVRSGTELTMTIGETTAAVKRGGVTEELTMDVAPYVDSATWRTYVPVRFAADAFGCNVGWDQAEQTVVIVDVEKLVNDTLAGKEFTLLDKLTAYNQKYSTGNWDMYGTCYAFVSMLGSDSFPILTGSMGGTISGETGAEMEMDMDMDLTELMSYFASMEDAASTDLGLTSDNLQMQMTMDMKMDLASGTMYYKLNDELTQSMGLPANTWLSMDLHDITAQNGMGWNSSTLTMQPGGMGASAMLQSILAGISLDNRAADGYAAMSDTLHSLVTAFADEAFSEIDNYYETSFTLYQNDMYCVITLDLVTNSADDVTRYDLGISMLTSLDEESAASLAALGLPMDQLALDLIVSMDENDTAHAYISLALPPLFELGMTMDMEYHAADKAPDTALPADANVVDYSSYIARTLPLE